MAEYIETPTEMVAEFMLKFEPPMTGEFWMKLVLEELAETQEAIAHLLKELADLSYVTSGLMNVVGPKAAQAVFDEAGISVEVVKVLALTKSLQPLVPESFKRVHASNMSKLDDNGNVIRREDGKILKGPNYKPPVLDDLVR